MRIIIIIIACVLTAAPALAQGESTLGAEFRLEGEAIKEDCKSLKTFVSCASTLATNHPVHVAIGSIAPQNGFAFGPAIVAERPIGENWRFSWSGDVVGATGGAWRAGAYLKMVRTGVRLPTPVGAGRRIGCVRRHQPLSGLQHLRAEASRCRRSRTSASAPTRPSA